MTKMLLTVLVTFIGFSAYSQNSATNGTGNTQPVSVKKNDKQATTPAEMKLQPVVQTMPTVPVTKITEVDGEKANELPAPTTPMRSANTEINPTPTTKVTPEPVQEPQPAGTVTKSIKVEPVTPK